MLPRYVQTIPRLHLLHFAPLPRAATKLAPSAPYHVYNHFNYSLSNDCITRYLYLNMKLQIALGVILTLAALVISEHINPAALSNWFLDTPSATALNRRGDFDSSKFGDQATWDKYVKKGDRLLCLMAASDRAAGYLEQDTRNPPSAASRWAGNLKSVYN